MRDTSPAKLLADNHKLHPVTHQQIGINKHYTWHTLKKTVVELTLFTVNMCLFFTLLSPLFTCLTCNTWHCTLNRYGTFVQKPSNIIFRTFQAVQNEILQIWTTETKLSKHLLSEL